MVYFQKSPLFIYWKGTHTNALQETKGMLTLEAKGEGGNRETIMTPKKTTPIIPIIIRLPKK